MIPIWFLISFIESESKYNLHKLELYLLLKFVNLKRYLIKSSRMCLTVLISNFVDFAWWNNFQLEVISDMYMSVDRVSNCSEILLDLFVLYNISLKLFKCICWIKAKYHQGYKKSYGSIELLALNFGLWTWVFFLNLAKFTYIMYLSTKDMWINSHLASF